MKFTLARFGACLPVVFALAGGAGPVLAAPGAVPVLVVSETPVETFVQVFVNSSISFNNQLYVVPAGKMLIVDSVTLSALTVGSSVPMAGLILNKDSGGGIVSIASVSPTSSTALTAGTQPLHMHVVAGNTLVINLFASSGNSVNAVVGMSGHLVDAP